MKRVVYLFFLLGISLTACKKCKQDLKPKDQLPPETQTGQNTFGCLVNGQVWVDYAPFPINALTGSWYNGSFGITAVKKKNGINQYISIGKTNVFSPNTFILNNSDSAQVHFSDLTNGCDYYTDSVNTGQLVITRLDTINGIVSGRFSFKLKQSKCPDIEVTEGRFDYKFH